MAFRGRTSRSGYNSPRPLCSMPAECDRLGVQLVGVNRMTGRRSWKRRGWLQAFPSSVRMHQPFLAVPPAWGRTSRPAHRLQRRVELIAGVPPKRDGFVPGDVSIDATLRSTINPSIRESLSNLSAEWNGVHASRTHCLSKVIQAAPIAEFTRQGVPKTSCCVRAHLRSDDLLRHGQLDGTGETGASFPL